MNLDSRTRTISPAPPEPSTGGAAPAGSSLAPETPPAPPPGKASVVWNEYVKPFLILALVLFAFRSSVADWNDVPTGSMKPTVLEGDRIFVNKLAYDLKFPFTTWRLARWSKPSRGEVVIFYQPGKGTRMVKRVIGVPGDKIELRNNQLIVNDQPVKYEDLDQSTGNELPMKEQAVSRFQTEYLTDHPHVVMLQGNMPGTPYYGPKVIPPGEYLMMGDNRNNSADSREWGFVPEENILGRSSRIVLSLDRESWYAPRFERFFKRLP